MFRLFDSHLAFPIARWFRPLSFLLLGLVLSAAPAAAESLLKEAERLYLAGIKLAQKGQYKAALAKFRASYRIVPSAKEPKNEFIRGTLHLLIGRTYHRMKQWKNARDHYRKYLGILKEDKRRGKVQGWLKAIRPYLLATLDLASTPKANCTVDYPGGQWQGQTPASIKLESGAVKIRCEADTYKPANAALTIDPKASINKELTLVPLPKPPKDLSWVGLIVGGVGIAAVGTGALFGGLASMDKNQAKETRDGAENPDDTIAAKSLYQGAQTKALTANVLYGVGGGLAITGLILYFVLRPRSTTTKRAFLQRPHPLRAWKRSRPLGKGAFDPRFWQGISANEYKFSSHPTSLAQP